MKIAIRTDSSVAIGAGHVMRCLTLAHMLKGLGAEIHFIHSDLKGNLSQVIKAAGFKVHVFSPDFEHESLSMDSLIAKMSGCSNQDVEKTSKILEKHGPFDWVIVDHYAFDSNWESQIYSYTKHVFVIDDMANRSHECDVLLDQNFHFDAASRYEGLVPNRCRLLLGTRFLLLRKEFHAATRNLKRRDQATFRLLIFFGGSDVSNETEKALRAVQMLEGYNLHVDVVVGASNPYKEKISMICAEIKDAVFHCQIDYMAELMCQADLAIGAGGSTTWERCYLGVPALVVILAENQRIGIEELEPIGAFINLGDYRKVKKELIYDQLTDLLNNPDKLRRMRQQTSKLVSKESIIKPKEWIEIFNGEKNQ